ncbi:MAG: replicative DNA helicase [Bacteroidota bacterium]
MENKSSSLRVGHKSNRLNRDIGESLGKLPPQASDLEEAVLGALMLEKDALTTVIDILKPESFYNDTHTEIYRAIVELFNNSEPVDMRTVANQLRKNGKLEFVGGAYYIAELTSKVSSAANIEYHARIVTEMSIKRELIRVASEIHNDAYEDTTDVFQLLDKTEGALFEISEANIRKNYDNMRSLMAQAISELEERKNHKDGLTGIASGFTALDRVTSGWQRSDLVIIAARPGMGKTAFVVSALRNAAVDFNHAVAIFSLEMSSVQLVNRLISAEAELESEKIKKGNLAEHEWQQLIHKTNKLSNAPIFIDDTPALSILELRAKCRRLKAQNDVQLIVIDYLQLMSGDSSKGAGNREQEIASISRALKGIAKELNVPVIALSQLSRAVETRGGDKRPQLSDLRESGSIEQDADMVMFLYRPEYYGITEDESGMPTVGTGEVIIAKHRSGSLENVNLKFIGKFTKFADLDNHSFDSPFPTSGIPSEFDDASTITLGSKLNESNDQGNAGNGLEPGDEEAPF